MIRAQARPKGLYMIWTTGLILGAAFGAVSAQRKGGKLLDMLQYAAAFAIAFGLLGLALGVLLDRVG